MKHILFVVPNYDYGGTITSLRNLLPIINRGQISIDIYAITNNGPAALEFAQYAHIIGNAPGGFSGQLDTKRSTRLNLTAIVKWIKRNLVKIGIDVSPFVFKYVGRKLSKNNYDTVIAFQEGQPTVLARYIECHVRIAWQHSIFSRFIQTADEKSYREVLSHYNKIVNVSYTACADFADCLPEFKDRLYVVYNSLDKQIIETKANEPIKRLGEHFNIISVGRIDSVKRFSKIPSLSKKLRERGLSFDWWIVGGRTDSSEYENLLQEIIINGVETQVHLLGKMQNPYPYIKASDLLVCLSSSETFNYTIAEAKALYVPVVTTDFPCAKEFVQNGTNGIVSGIETIDEEIYRVLTNEALYESIKSNLVREESMGNKVRSQFAELLNSNL